MKLSKEEIKELLTPGNWFQLPKAFIRKLSPIEAITLAYLFNYSTTFNTDENGYFICSFLDMETELGFTRQQQRKVIEKLEELEFIRTKRDEITRQRKLRLRVLSVMEILRKEVAFKRTPRGVQKNATSCSKERHLQSHAREKNYKENKTTVSPEGSTGGFFNKNETESTEQVFSQYLEDIIRKNRKLQALPNRKAWNKEFNKLIHEVGDVDRIWLVLYWYKENITKERVPWAYSAKSFREKFSVLESLMESKQKKNPATPKTNEVLSADGKKAYDLISHKVQFPNISQNELIGIINESITNYTKVFKALRAAADSSAVPSNVRDFVRLMLEKIHDNPTSFVSSWVSDMHDKIQKWQGWRGTAAQITFSTENADYIKLIQRESESYACSDKYVEPFFKIITK